MLRLLRQRAYWAHFGERLGFLPRSFDRTADGSVWLHAVSVGEVASAVPLLQELRRVRPRLAVYVSTTTLAGRRAARQNLAGLTNGVFYCPIDYVSCVRRVLSRIRPLLVVVLETEIWPNLYREVKCYGAKLVIVNARISNKTWPQYSGMKWFFSPVLQLPDLILPQSPRDFDRYLELGVPRSSLLMAGNLKYDATPQKSHTALPVFGAEQVWIAASTVEPIVKGDVDEDDVVLDAFEQLAKQFPRLLLILAPRQPVRFDEVAQKIARRNISFVRRTDLQKNPDAQLSLPGVLLLNTIGELAGCFHLANVVFVGGSLVHRGGHNIVEPAFSAVPIIVGPHMENFEAITDDFKTSSALIQIEQPEQLAPVVKQFLESPEQAAELGERARNVVHAAQGSASRIAVLLWPLYFAAMPHRRRGPFARLFLTPLAKLWTWGGRIKRDRALRHQGKLPVPVISVGGISVGGSGKTPFVAYLTKKLQRSGLRPAVLTRGYGRRSSASTLIFPPGAEVSRDLTGDEAQIFLRSSSCSVGIGTDRYETGKLLLQQLPADCFILDDGFQHAKLARNLDIVLIDGLDPFGQRHTVPLGRLREPLDALRRANVFVVSRADENLRFEAIARELHQLNPEAPVFRARVATKRWRDYRTGLRSETLPHKRVAAFCGLGNPNAFWETLEQLGLEVVFRWAFPDHHAYKPIELSRLASQAEILAAELLVTTEKDMLNLPTGTCEAISPFNLSWLEIENTVDREEEFLELLEPVLARQLV